MQITKAIRPLKMLLDMDIITPQGKFLGKVTNISVDVKSRIIAGLIIHEPRPELVADSHQTIMIPYQWVQAVGDVILLKTFANVPLKKTQ